MQIKMCKIKALPYREISTKLLMVLLYDQQVFQIEWLNHFGQNTYEFSLIVGPP